MLEATTSRRERRLNRRRSERRISTSPAPPSVVRSAHIPGLRIAAPLIPRLHEYVTGCLNAQVREVEVGGVWIGEFRGSLSAPEFHLNGMIEAGPNAECSQDSILFDSDYQVRALQEIRSRHPRAGNMGCFHFHPGQMDECSAGDYLADVAAVKESDTKALVFGILTRNNPRRDAVSIYCGVLKIDFFVLGEQTGYRYAHVAPVLEEAPLVTPAPIFASEPAGTENELEGLRFGPHHNWCLGLLEDKKRLVAEVRAMEERYGDRAVLKHARNQLYWEYTVEESGRKFPIEIRYPRRFPLEPPRLISVLPLPSSPHQLVNNELCWINRAAGDWNPGRDTAATCIHAAHRWFACLLVYLTLGKWPEEANDEPLRTL
jgi:hypothetical protein